METPRCAQILKVRIKKLYAQLSRIIFFILLEIMRINYDGNTFTE